MRKNIVAGNWKMNKTLQEGIALAKELNEALANEKPNCDVDRLHAGLHLHLSHEQLGVIAHVDVRCLG